MNFDLTHALQSIFEGILNSGHALIFFIIFVDCQSFESNELQSLPPSNENDIVVKYALIRGPCIG